MTQLKGDDDEQELESVKASRVAQLRARNESGGREAAAQEAKNTDGRNRHRRHDDVEFMKTTMKNGAGNAQASEAMMKDAVARRP